LYEINNKIKFYLQIIMYLSFYNLKYKPFQISTDPKFLWLGEKHEEALATLKYGVLDNKGFLLLTGDVGTGKTTLINTLLKTFGKNTLVASIRDPDLEPMDFYHYAAHAFGLENNFTSKGTFLIQFEQFLHDAYNAKKEVLLIIDEAQRINQNLLEEVRLLSNIEREDSKLLNIFFVGQIEFNEILLRTENKPIRQRITVNYNIPILTKEETGEYVLHRLKIAGSEEQIFEEEALDEIYFFSKGYPRLINIICDRSLLTGFVEESKTISRKHVKECAKELTIPLSTRNNRTVQAVATSENNANVPLQRSVSASHISNRKRDRRNKDGTAWNSILAIGILLLIILGYFSFSKNTTITYQGHTIRELAQDFWKQADKGREAKSTDTENKKMSPQHKPIVENKQKQIKQEKVLSTTTLQEDGDKVTEKKRNENPKITETVVETPGVYEQAKVAKSATVEKGVDQHLEIETKSNELDKSISTDSVPNASEPPPVKNITNETEKIVDQQIQVQPLFTFTKLVIPFPSNSNFPPVSSLNNLNMLVKSLLKQPSYEIIVTGFTDSQGNEAFNEKLSEFRANTIKSYLVGKGLEESRITTQGLGSQYPVASNDTFSGRMTNRRVEIEMERKN